MESLETALDMVIRRLAHDIRNPIVVILANLRYLQDEIDQPDLLEAVEETLFAARRANKMIDDVADLQRIDEKVKTVAESFNLKELQSVLSQALEPQRGTRQLEINLPAVRIRASDLLVQRALYNIVEHCLRQTPSEGEVTLQGVHADGVTLHITDQGLPFSPDVQPSILAPSLSVPTSRESSWRSDQGLAIHFSGKVLRSIGATVEISSREDGCPGVRFSINFPQEIVVE